ncbi:MAG: EcsC family protein [Actinomycetes bacterium]
MGLFDMFRRDEDIKTTRSALDEANNPDGTDDAVTRMILQLTRVGIDGVGPFDGARRIAEKAREKASGTEEAVERVIGQHLAGGAVTGFVTGVGGFVTMIVAIPANVFSFYVQATRMAAAVAHLRGYDVTDPRIRTAVLLALVGSNSADLLAKAGVTTGTHFAVDMASRNLPRPALMVIQKAVGFQILRRVGERVFARVGKLAPVAGGAIGAGVDFAMMRRIADQAKAEFPQTA